jgi:ketosteroid isomerase-like protein
MNNGFRALVLGLSAILLTGKAQEQIPAELVAMADTERAFAKAATIKGWRNAFLEFFADDAIAFAPEVALAKDRLRKQPDTPFSVFELVWEPRTGDVASSGDLGWLTGPSTSINHKLPDKKPRYGCYLSVWRKQPDGTWRVFIDVGADSPEPVPFAPGFNRIALKSRYAGRDDPAKAKQLLAAADAELNAQMMTVGVPKAFAATMTPASRLHRPGHVPIVGSDAIQAWLAQHSSSGTAGQKDASSSAAGDFGFTHGTFETRAPTAVKGVYVRLWSRDAAGTWWLVVDVAQNTK